jgi:ribosomal-protein-serine acetyltransferase
MSLDRINTLVFTAGNQKIRLRPINKSDKEAMVQFAKRNLGIINGPFPVTTEALTKGNAQAERWISEKISNSQEEKGVVCIIEAVENSRIIGYISAFMFDWRIPKCEIAWMVDSDFQRKGIASACCSYVLSFLTEDCGLQKVICRIDPKNKASLELAKKMHFVQEGVHKRDFRDGYGRLLDVCYYALLP